MIYSDLMIDLETLSTAQNSCIFDIGLCFFNALNPDRSDMHVDHFLVSPDNGHISAATVDWWMEQEPEARERLKAAVRTGRNMGDALSWLYGQITKYGVGTDVIRVWGHGPCFDITILEYHIGESAYLPMWSYRNIRDTRTLNMLVDGRCGKPEDYVGRLGGTFHKAEHDAQAQAMWVRDMIAMLRKEGMGEYVSR